LWNKRAVLFFDEADTLSDKRRDNRETHDRYVNQEKTHRQQRFGTGSGRLILASKLRGSFDRAFPRQCHALEHFAIPRRLGRRRVWHKLLAGNQVPFNGIGGQ